METITGFGKHFTPFIRLSAFANTTRSLVTYIPFAHRTPRTLSGQKSTPVTCILAPRSLPFVLWLQKRDIDSLAQTRLVTTHSLCGKIRSLPSFFRESRDAFGLKTYIGGVERLKQISALPVINVETGDVIRLCDLDPVYSDEWLAVMTKGPAAS
jgi:hypothetical protein